ncbi:Protein of unknown function [Pyronema omphalodes CBS 100304]|uniref:Uncharacterized protein n=1 Tax=Pyronema omphalodes (strain CBS 100304) TaxID=1076935 RepID=U4LCW6_PYROM|nr:Protein of unknown function [Pyronema omphalodes CBS 100304]
MSVRKKLPIAYALVVFSISQFTADLSEQLLALITALRTD